MPAFAADYESRDVITYRIVTDGEGLFLLPYDCWLLPPYAYCHWLRYDPVQHGHLPVVNELKKQRGERYD